MYSYEKIQPHPQPTFAGRIKARSPEPMGSRGRWTNVSSTGYLPNGGFTESRSASADLRRLDLSDDDEADPDSSYGSYDDWGGDTIHSSGDIVE